jgi:hypothetical protein
MRRAVTGAQGRRQWRAECSGGERRNGVCVWGGGSGFVFHVKDKRGGPDGARSSRGDSP